MKDGKITVVGSVDPVNLVGKLRRSFANARLVSIGPTKEAYEFTFTIGPGGPGVIYKVRYDYYSLHLLLSTTETDNTSRKLKQAPSSTGSIYTTAYKTKTEQPFSTLAIFVLKQS